MKESRKAYTDSNDILEEVRVNLERDGLSINKKQIQFLYSVIVRFIDYKIKDKEVNVIRIPHIGNLYRKSNTEGCDGIFKINKTKLLTDVFRFTRGKSLKDIIKKQNEEYK